MSKKRFLSIILSVVMLLSLACSALAAEQSGRYIGDSTVNGSIYQTYYQVDAQTRTGIKSISVSGTLYEKGTFGTRKSFPSTVRLLQTLSSFSHSDGVSCGESLTVRIMT